MCLNCHGLKAKFDCNVAESIAWYMYASQLSISKANWSKNLIMLPDVDMLDLYGVKTQQNKYCQHKFN